MVLIFTNEIQLVDYRYRAFLYSYVFNLIKTLSMCGNSSDILNMSNKENIFTGLFSKILYNKIIFIYLEKLYGQSF